MDFSGGSMTSDSGAILLGRLDEKLGITRAAASALGDSRRAKSVTHSVLGLVRQRVFGLACGYEDLNDHDTLRHDIALQTAVGRDSQLASRATLSRFENGSGREQAVALHQVLLETFIKSFDSPPEELVLDFDATDDVVHGMQQGRFFHGYYDKYCFLPLYVFCGQQLLVAYLRPARKDGAMHAGAILKLLTARLRQEWPEVRIIYRADSGFCRPRVLRWCERNDVKYAVGIARNAVLERHGTQLQRVVEKHFQKFGEKGRAIGEFRYAAKTWRGGKRRIIIRAEHGAKGRNPRFVVTNLDDPPDYVYDELYCQRGNAENRIKEQQLDLFADRTSCHQWWANQFRLLLSSLAYTLMERLRALLLKGTDMANAQCGTIRDKLIKVGAVVVRNTRRVYLRMSSACPYQARFMAMAQAIVRMRV
jgi:hypothetical protein